MEDRDKKDEQLVYLQKEQTHKALKKDYHT